MASFPKSEQDVVALADQMVLGLTQYPADFPSIDVMELTGVLTNLKSLRGAQETAKSQSQIATVTKDEQLNLLIDVMRNDLKLAEVDTAAAPEKLTEIGWGPRSQPTPMQAPGVPTSLRATAESTGEIWLAWDKPASESGGTVRNYLVEKAEMQPSGSMGPWIFVQSTYNNDAHLTGQPSNLRMLYRVKASNAGGESDPSNTLLVVLP